MIICDGEILYFGVKARIVGDFILKDPITTHSNGLKDWIDETDSTLDSFIN